MNLELTPARIRAINALLTERVMEGERVLTPAGLAWKNSGTGEVRGPANIVEGSYTALHTLEVFCARSRGQYVWRLDSVPQYPEAEPNGYEPQFRLHIAEYVKDPKQQPGLVNAVSSSVHFQISLAVVEVLLNVLGADVEQFEKELAEAEGPRIALN